MVRGVHVCLVNGVAGCVLRMLCVSCELRMLFILFVLCVHNGIVKRE